MPTIEDQLWKKIAQPHLPAGPDAKLDKKQQQDLSVLIQHWVADCIQHYLTQLIEPKILKDWSIVWRGKKNFMGAVRWQEVDVWIANPDAGLVLACDPKHLQSRDSLGKNWKNTHNDLVAFSSNLHERFPLCAVGGVIAYPEWAGSPTILEQMHGICSRSIPRDKPLNAYGKFEGFALVIYDSKGLLTWPFAPDSPLKPAFAFEALAEKVYSRTVAIL